MPNRYIREGWLDSDKTRAVGEAAEVMLLRLLLVADDFARFDGRPTVIQRRCWPAGNDEPGLPAPAVEEIVRRIAILADKRLVVPYQVDGKPYLYIPNFQQRTRATKSKFPPPPENVGHVTDKGPTVDGQGAGIWRTHDSQPADTPPPHDGAPQAGSGSGSGSGTYSGSRARQAVDKATSKPMLPSKGISKTDQILEEQRIAADRAAPPPEGFMDKWKKPTDHFQPIRAKGPGNGNTPPREPGQDDEEHEPTPHRERFAEDPEPSGDTNASDSHHPPSESAGGPP